MKIKSISLRNFAKYGSVTVNLSDKTTYLVGPNGAGKSTIGIVAIWFALQSIAEKSSNGTTPLIGERFRFIGEFGKTASVELVLFDEKLNTEIHVSRKLTKTGSELSFISPDGMELTQEWLNNLFNVFLIAPKRFMELSSKEQALELGIDVSSWNEQIAEKKTEFTRINKELSAYDNLEEVEEVQEIDLADLQIKKDALKQSRNEQYLANQKHNDGLHKAWQDKKKEIDQEVEEFNNVQRELTLAHNACFNAHGVLCTYGYAGNEVSVFLESIKKKIKPQITTPEYPEEPKYIEEFPDESEIDDIDRQMAEAAVINEKAGRFKAYKQKLADREMKRSELNKNKQDQESLYEKRLEYIRSFKMPFSALTVDEEGNLLLGDKPLRSPYYSTGELIRYVTKILASRQPELKYIFLQDFNLLDEEMQNKLEVDLTAMGYQLVIEYVGTELVRDKNCILLKDSNVMANTVNDQQ